MIDSKSLVLLTRLQVVTDIPSDMEDIVACEDNFVGNESRPGLSDHGPGKSYAHSACVSAWFNQKRSGIGRGQQSQLPDTVYHGDSRTV